MKRRNKSKENEKSMKSKILQKGITLVSLVITIIVLLILAGAGINVAINADGLTEKAEEATYKHLVSTMQEELTLYIAQKQLEELGVFEKNKLNANAQTLIYNGEEQENKTIKDILTGCPEAMLQNYAIVNGELKYIGNDSQEYEWFASTMYNKEDVALATKESETGRITLEGTIDGYIEDYTIYGETIQNGIPSPSEEAVIESVGENGTIEIISYGKNLLKGTNTLDKNDEVFSIYGQIQTDELYNECYTLKTNNAWHGYRINFSKIAKRVGIKAGDIVTYSIWAKLDGIPINDSTYSVYYGSGGSVYYNEAVGEIKKGVENNWKQLSYTFEVTEEILNVTSFRIESNYFENSNYTTSIANVIFACPQLEIGENATEYEEYKEEKTVINLNTKGSLRNINEDKDYIKYSNGAITRNTGITIIDTDELLFFEAGDYINMPFYTSSNIKEAGVLSNYFPRGVLAANKNYDFIFIGRTNMEKYFSSVSELNSFIKGKQAEGNPVKFYYTLESSSNEYIFLPKIKTFENVTNIKVNTNVEPSKIEVKYIKNK